MRLSTAMASPGQQLIRHLPRVLIVEDDAEMRTYIRECLAALPVHVEEALDGLDALAQIQAGRQDVALVITDIVMPRLDGLALKSALQAEPQWVSLPVLLITGEAVRASEGPVLRKPFNARRLRAAVRALLDL